MKETRDFEGQINRWIIFPLLDGKDGLAGDPQLVGKSLLREVVHRTKDLDIILHLCPIPRISARNRS
jgi:hypothetical protein